MRIRFLFLVAAGWLAIGDRARAADASLSGRVLDSGGTAVAGARVFSVPFRTPDQTLLDLSAGREPAPVAETKTGADGAFRLATPKDGSSVSLRILAEGLPAVEIEGPFDAGGEEELDVSVPRARRVCGRVTDESGKPVEGARIRAQAPLEDLDDATAVDTSRSSADGSFCLAASPDSETATHLVRAAGFAAASADARPRSNQRLVLKKGGSVAGAVFDPSGKAVSGAIVTSGDAAVETDAAGRYRFEALPGGSATLRVVWKDDLFVRRDGVRVRPGAVTETDLRLSTSAGIQGLVLDAQTRKPVARARVSVGLSKFAEPGVPPVARARTDSRGRFRLAGLVTREYQLSVSSAGYVSTTMPVAAKTPPAGSIRVSLAPAAAVTGRVVDEEGRPIRGARVQLDWSAGRRAMFFGDPSRPVPSSLTNEKGVFRLTGLAPDIVVAILATSEGFVATRKGGIRTGTGKGGKSLTLTLIHGLEARGRVVDGSGDAIAGAEVQLSRTMERRVGGGTVSGDAPESIRKASSDGQGRFVLRALDSGKYEAEIRHPSYATRQLAAVEVKPHGVTEWAPFVLSPSAPVAGVVRNAKGTPIAGATIVISSAEGGFNECQTDAGGQFRQDGYAAGAKLSLRITAEGFAMTRQSVQAPAPDVAIVLTTAGVVRGRAEDGDTQKPITTGSVAWRVPRGYGAEKQDFHSDDGTFEVGGITPGKIEITASAPGYLDGRVTGLEIAEGETKEGVVVSLKKGRAMSGRVLDPQRGNGVANATVSWRRPSERDQSGFAVGSAGAYVMVANAATTDADGRFEYDAVPPEKLVFKASHPDYLDAEQAVDASSESAVDITLSEGGSILGFVRSADGTSAVPGADVTLQGSGAEPFAISGDESQSDEGGAFAFAHLKEGRYVLTARIPSGRSAKTDVLLSPGQNAEGVVLKLAPGATLRGTVTGLPVEKRSGLEVRAYQSSFSGQANTDASGEFAITDVPPGVVTVSASTARWGPGTRSVSKSVEIPDGAAEVPVEIAFSGTSQLDVHLTRRDQPMAGIGLNVRPDPGSTARSQVLGETDADGRAVLEGLEDGTYVLGGSSYAGGGGSFDRQITVSGDTSIEVALGRSSIVGTVTDAASGEPLPDASVSAENGQETYRYEIASVRSDSQGNYTLDSLDPGNFQVTARRDGYKQKTLSVTAGDSPAALSFPLSRGGGLTVVAKDGLTGLPLSGLSALAFSDSGTVAFSGSVALDAGGTGEIQSLAPGTYALYFASAGYAVKSLSGLTVPSSPVALSLSPGGRLEVRAGAAASGRILDAVGQPYLFSLWTLDGRLSLSPPISVWDHVSPGSYRLIVDGADGPKSFPFSVTEGETTRIDLP